MAASVTRTSLGQELRALGVREGGVLIVHTRMSALGWVVGAAETVVLALLDALGPAGTLMAFASWEEHAYQLQERPAEHRDAYAREPPVFDLATSEAVRENGRVPERIRTWPGAQRSVHPEASLVAVGPRAGWLVRPHPAVDGYGAGTPFARIVEAEGQVLMLGAPLETITLLHHAEALAQVPGKRQVTYRVLVATPTGPEERIYTDFETTEGVVDYGGLGLDADEFEVIGRDALAAGIGVSGSTGAATSHLFPARELVAFGVEWIERRFG